MATSKTNVLAVFFAFLCVPLISRADDCKENMKWNRTSTIDSDGKVIAKWNIVGEYLYMIMIGKTKGWVGLGFSRAGGMKGADMVVGWVKNNKPFVQDRYGISDEAAPIIDTKQSYVVTGGSENSTHTMVCFKRKLDTCDNQDLVLNESTIFLMWAFQDKDPVNDSVNGLEYHGMNRGEQLENILAKTYPKPAFNFENYDMKFNNFQVDIQDDTFYYCRHAMIPKQSKKHYIVGWEALIEGNKEKNLYHFVFYRCPTQYFEKNWDKIKDQEYQCFDPQMGNISGVCVSVFLFWARGADEIQYAPSSPLMEFGNTDHNSYYKLEIYFRGENVPDQRDSSGLRLFHSEVPQPGLERTAGMLTVGPVISPLLLIPPKQDTFSTIGLCQTKCLQKVVPKDGVTVYMMATHAHLIAFYIGVTVIRDGKEIVLYVDDNYHFNKQGLFFLNKEFKIMPNDMIVTECRFNSSQRNKTTIASFPTASEMCLVALNFYPAVNITQCASYLKPEDIYKLTGVTAGKTPNAGMVCETEGCPSLMSNPGAIAATPVTDPKTKKTQMLVEYETGFNDWTELKIDKLKQMYRSEQRAVCCDTEGPFYSTDKDFAGYPKDAKPSQMPNQCTV